MKLLMNIPYSVTERLLTILHFRNLSRSKISFTKILGAIILNKRIERNGYTLSNYGVWMVNRVYDRTFQASILGYRNKLEKIISSIKEPTTFIDIGANQGVFSLVAAANPSVVKIHSFEPNLKICDSLQLNFAVNNVSKYNIHNVAISTKDSQIKFFVSENHSGAGRISLSESNMTVRSVNHLYLNSKITETHTQIFIKIDVEGHELEVLQELFKSKLNLNIKNIFIEIIRDNQNEVSTLQILHENRFTEKFRKSNLSSYDALFTR